MVTHIDHGGRGFGAAVMRRLQAKIGDLGLDALSPAVPEWYAKLGRE